MTAVAAAGAPARPRGLGGRIAWSWRYDAKFELAMAWWAVIAFNQIFGIVFFVMTRVMPPPKPWWSQARVVQWFNDNHVGLLYGFGIIFLIAGLTAAQNALIAYSMRRMSVSRAFAYSYVAIYSASTIPGMLLTAILLSVGAMRPERSPEIISWLYDGAIMTFDGTMGIFLIGTIVWMIAVLIDKNRVLPKWFGYLNICNAITELVISPAWIVKRGPFSWNGVITFWIDTAVFIIYLIAWIMLVRRMIERDDLRDGPLPQQATALVGDFKCDWAVHNA
jgi:hypothetical protein